MFGNGITEGKSRITEGGSRKGDHGTGITEGRARNSAPDLRVQLRISIRPFNSRGCGFRRASPPSPVLPGPVSDPGPPSGPVISRSRDGPLVPWSRFARGCSAVAHPGPEPARREPSGHCWIHQRSEASQPSSFRHFVGRSVDRCVRWSVGRIVAHSGRTADASGTVRSTYGVSAEASDLHGAVTPRSCALRREIGHLPALPPRCFT